MRLIDADALKKDLTRFYDNEVTARELIDEQPTGGGWVSVNNRLPEKSGCYLAIMPTGCLIVLNYSNKYKLFNCFDDIEPNGHELKEVTHWMPLPSPPKEDEDA